MILFLPRSSRRTWSSIATTKNNRRLNAISIRKVSGRGGGAQGQRGKVFSEYAPEDILLARNFAKVSMYRLVIVIQGLTLFAEYLENLAF